MIVLTMIARVADGLPLAASVTEDEQAGRNVLEYQNQAKQLFRKMNENSPSRGSLETGPYHFHYFIENGVCYLALCDQSFSKRLAFSYLEELQNEFNTLYGKRVNQVSRPYSFIEFDTFIQKSKKSFMDSRARRNLNQVNLELRDVQRIMVQNIEDVLLRGEQLVSLDDKASNLSTMAKKYKKDAHSLNNMSMYAKIAAALFFVFCLMGYFLW